MEERDRRGRTTSDRRKTAGTRTAGSAERPAGTRTARNAERPAGTRTTRNAERPAGTRTAGSTERPAGAKRSPGVSAERAGKGQVSGERRRRTGSQAAQAGRRRPQNPDSRTASDRTRTQRPQASAGTAGRKPVRGKKQSRRRRKRNLIVGTIFLFIFVIAAAAAVFVWKRYGPSKERMDLSKYYGIENENQLAVIVNNEILDPEGMVEEGKAYVRYEIIRDYVNSRFYWDPNENVLLYTLPNDTVSVEVGSKDYNISKEKNSADYVILKTEGNTAYIALDFVQQYTNIEYEVYDSPGRVVIVSDWGETRVADVKRDTQVRYRGGVKSPILTDISKSDEVTVIESEENWKKVRTKDGFIGYVTNRSLKKTRTEAKSRDFDEPEYTNIKKDYVINMAWHNVTNAAANSSVLQRIAKTKGLTTIAPTWFYVEDVEGNLKSTASSDYVSYAHQANIEVWATVRDFDGGIGSNKESYELLSHTSRREKLVNQLIAETLQIGADGINVDFEKISNKCGEHYIQFIRELSVRCRQNSLVLSVDNYVPKGFNQQYNRKEQGIVADYVIIMGYDEHYGGSPEAGSVSSYNFVKEGIEETLKEVPAQKIISGIPFFTRVWKETDKTEEELSEQSGTEEGNYKTNVSSETYGMSSARNEAEEAGAKISWDEETQQNFASWKKGGATYKVWLEDEKSIEPKLKLMKDNGLAGTAAWALGQEDPDIWKLIQKYTN